MRVRETKDAYTAHKMNKITTNLYNVKIREKALQALRSGYTSKEHRKQTINSIMKLPHFDWQTDKIAASSKYAVKVVPRNKIISFYLKALFYKFINKFYLNK